MTTKTQNYPSSPEGSGFKLTLTMPAGNDGIVNAYYIQMTDYYL